MSYIQWMKEYYITLLYNTDFLKFVLTIMLEA